MAVMQTRKSERLEARITRHQKKAIERAASLKGVNVTDFIVQSLQQFADEIIRESQAVTLRAEASKVFVNALLNPPAPNAALRAAAKRHLSVRV